MNRFISFARELKRYPSAIAGLVLIALFLALALYSLIMVPQSHAVQLWRAGIARRDSPRNARPVWYNALPWVNLPRTLVLDSAEHPELKRYREISEEHNEIEIAFEFDYHYDAFPRELNLFLRSEYESRRPFASVRWVTPDGRSFSLSDGGVDREQSIRIDQLRGLRRELGDVAPRVGLFADPASAEGVPQVLHGTYRVEIEGVSFEPDSDIEARFVRYGQVHGLAGTDHIRRDIAVALLFGTRPALAFGILAAVGSTVTTLVLAAVGVWFRGKVDAAIQRVTEVNMVLPLLPVLVMVGTLYSRSIWVMLGVVILFGIFSAGIKTYRAMFLQIRELAYIEAARAYGAGNTRIIFRYMIPKVLPTLIPSFVTVIPAFVFLEATLAMIGLGDPVLPTWGKVLEDAYRNGALYRGQYYWVLLPSSLLILTGLGFAMFGFALDRVFNPRLRER